MDRRDYFCDYLEHLRVIQLDCCDYNIYKCEKHNVIFDEFHDECIKCKDNTCEESW